MGRGESEARRVVFFSQVGGVMCAYDTGTFQIEKVSVHLHFYQKGPCSPVDTGNAFRRRGSSGEYK